MMIGSLEEMMMRFTLSKYTLATRRKKTVSDFFITPTECTVMSSWSIAQQIFFIHIIWLRGKGTSDPLPTQVITTKITIKKMIIGPISTGFPS
jgi:hypothetical protein